MSLTCVPESPLQLLAVLLSLLLWLVDWELTELLDVSYVSLELRPAQATLNPDPASHYTLPESTDRKECLTLAPAPSLSLACL